MNETKCAFLLEGLKHLELWTDAKTPQGAQ